MRFAREILTALSTVFWLVVALGLGVGIMYLFAGTGIDRKLLAVLVTIFCLLGAGTGMQFTNSWIVNHIWKPGQRR